MIRARLAHPDRPVPRPGARIEGRLGLIDLPGGEQGYELVLSEVNNDKA